MERVSNERVSNEITYQSYCKQVCSVLKKATQKEKSALSEELLDHMESHAEALIELGWDPEEARTYAIQAMGDAETVGRQYDEKLSSFWLWCGYVVRWALIVFILFLLLNGVLGVKLHHMMENLEARQNPEKVHIDNILRESFLYDRSMDLTIEQGAQYVHVYRVETHFIPERDQYFAAVYVVNYAKNPLEYTGVNSYIEGYRGYAGQGSAGASYRRYTVYVEEGQPFVMLVIPVPGEDTRVQIPIPWEVSYE